MSTRVCAPIISPPCGFDLRVSVEHVGLPSVCASAEAIYRLQAELPTVWLFVVNYKYPKTKEESSTAAINRPHCDRQLRRMDGCPPSWTDIDRGYRMIRPRGIRPGDAQYPADGHSDNHKPDHASRATRSGAPARWGDQPRRCRVCACARESVE